MKNYRADLHIHSCLSPCAELEMSPRNIIRSAEQSGMDIIGICDHNSCENVPYIMKSAENTAIKVTGGIEVTSREEVHILALFDTEEELFKMQDFIYAKIYGYNDEYRYGDQVIVNENDEVIDFNRRLLIGAADISIEGIVDRIHELNGIAIASHIDRERFSILSQLGFVPEGLHLDAYEVSTREELVNYQGRYSPLVVFSDAHSLGRIGSEHSSFYMEGPNLDEIGKAFTGTGGRAVFA